MDIVDINEKVFIAILIKLFGMLSAFYITNMYREFEYILENIDGMDLVI